MRALQPLSPKTALARDIIFQAIWLLGLFWILTGGGFVLSHENHLFLSAHPGLFRLSLVLTFAAGGLSAFLRYRMDPLSFRELGLITALHRLGQVSPKVWVGSVAFFYAVTQFLSLFFMHRGLGTALWDFGFNDQIIWNTAHGQFLINSVRGGQNILGEHFFLIHAFLAPLYWATDHEEFLFLIQSTALASSIPLTYAIALKVTEDRPFALICAAAVFFYAPLRNGLLFPFHAETFADPLLLLGFYSLLCGKKAAAFLAFLWVLTCKENFSVEIFSLGLFLISQKRKSGWVFLVLSIAAFLLITQLVEKSFRFDYAWNKWGYFDHFFHPSHETWLRVAELLIQKETWLFWFRVFAPVLFLPLWTWGGWVLLAPNMLIRLLSPFPGFRIITAHYTVGLNALIFISTVYGWKKLSGSKKEIFRILFLSSSLMLAGIPQLFLMEKILWEASSPENQRMARVLENIPSSYSVVSTETFLAHLTHRHELFGFGTVRQGAPLESKSLEPDLLVVDGIRVNENEKGILQKFLDQGYRILFRLDTLAIYADPTLSSASAEELRHKWEEAAAFRVTPYRKIIRFWYKRLLLGAALFLIFLSLYRTFGLSTKMPGRSLKAFL